MLVVIALPAGKWAHKNHWGQLCSPWNCLLLIFGVGPSWKLWQFSGILQPEGSNEIYDAPPVKNPINQVADGVKTVATGSFERYRKWRYRNTALLLASLVIFWYFADSELARNTVSLFGELGYIGAFMVGIFFVSTFTVAPAAVVLFYLADLLSPIAVAALAGTGAVVGDYIIFRFLKDRIFTELKPLFLRFGGSYLKSLFFSPYFAWLTPIIGAAIIASPLPDEVGVGILGISKLKTWQFLVLSFTLNFLGILIIVTLAKAT